MVSIYGIDNFVNEILVRPVEAGCVQIVDSLRQKISQNVMYPLVKGTCTV